MHRLEVHTQEALHAALLSEGRRSLQSRFVHRLHCMQLVGAGQSCYTVAVLFGDSPRTVERWVHQFQQYGIEGLKEKPRLGRRATLSDGQMKSLELAMGAHPRELGHTTDAWDSRSLRAEILRRFGVTLSRRHCLRLLSTLRQSSVSGVAANLQAHASPDAALILSHLAGRSRRA